LLDSVGRVPNLVQAETFLKEAEERNPGPWVAHSRLVAQAAGLISDSIPGLQPQTAYSLGLLHDIGRREGVTGMRHVIDGYRFLSAQGYDGAARICMTHSYPIKNVASGSAKWDGTRDEYDFAQAYLDAIDYNLYDRLIQLCDALSMASGYCLMEKRMVDVALRYGTNKYTVMKWKAFLEIKDEFDHLAVRPVYSLLPGVVDHTFGDLGRVVE
jgi:HD superfamily phosphodiesterase